MSKWNYIKILVAVGLVGSIVYLQGSVKNVSLKVANNIVNGKKMMPAIALSEEFGNQVEGTYISSIASTEIYNFHVAAATNEEQSQYAQLASAKLHTSPEELAVALITPRDTTINFL